MPYLIFNKRQIVSGHNESDTLLVVPAFGPYYTPPYSPVFVLEHEAEEYLSKNPDKFRDPVIVELPFYED